MLSCALGYVAADVPKDRKVIIFKVKQSLLGLSNYLPVHKEYQPRRFRSSNLFFIPLECFTAILLHITNVEVRTGTYHVNTVISSIFFLRLQI
jgi:hypothetical protein